MGETSTHFLCRPRTVIDLWFETVIPSFPALIPIARLDVLGNLSPFHAVLLDRGPESLVFFGRPHSFSKVVG